LYLGLDDQTVADLNGYSVEHIKHIKNHPPVQQHIRELQADQRHKMACLADRFDALTQKSLDVLEKSLNLDIDPLDDNGNPIIPLKDRLRAAEMVLDRHPGGQFVKRSKSETQHNVTVYDGREIAQLRERPLTALDVPHPEIDIRPSDRDIPVLEHSSDLDPSSDDVLSSQDEGATLPHETPLDQAAIAPAPSSDPYLLSIPATWEAPDLEEVPV
jgi:hypothetical protein